MIKKLRNFSKQNNLFNRKILTLNLHPNITHHIAAASDANTTARWCSTPASITTRPHILIGLKNHKIDFWREETRKHNRRTDIQTHAQTRRLNLVVIRRAKVDGNGGEENDVCRVHREANVLCLIKVLRNFPRLECVKRAEWHQEDDENERDHETVAGALAGKNGGKWMWINFTNIWWIVDKPCN